MWLPMFAGGGSVPESWAFRTCSERSSHVRFRSTCWHRCDGPSRRQCLATARPRPPWSHRPRPQIRCFCINCISLVNTKSMRPDIGREHHIPYQHRSYRAAKAQHQTSMIGITSSNKSITTTVDTRNCSTSTSRSRRSRRRCRSRGRSSGMIPVEKRGLELGPRLLRLQHTHTSNDTHTHQ